MTTGSLSRSELAILGSDQIRQHRNSYYSIEEAVEMVRLTFVVITLVVISLIFMGISLIVEIRFPVFFTISKAPTQRGLIGIFLYGIAYGLATMGCSAPIFFSTLLYAVASGGPLYVAITFVVYAIGMGIPIIITTILVAKARKLMVERMINMIPRFRKISGIILMIIGAYLIYFYFSSFYAV